MKFPGFPNTKVVVGFGRKEATFTLRPDTRPDGVPCVYLECSDGLSAADLDKLEQVFCYMLRTIDFKRAVGDELKFCITAEESAPP